MRFHLHYVGVNGGRGGNRQASATGLIRRSGWRYFHLVDRALTGQHGISS
jgi:hypothetical protein